MWMIDPKILCRKHLLGEHVEIHMLVGSLQRKRSIAGFLNQGILEPQNALKRHAALVAEMQLRGYKHASKLQDVPHGAPSGHVDQVSSLTALLARCEACSTRYNDLRS